MNVSFEINVDVMQLTHKLDIKFRAYKFIINIDNIQYNLGISIIFLNKLIINIIKTLTNNYVSFKFNNINKRLKIVQH